jgi:arsenite methyltransferase
VLGLDFSADMLHRARKAANQAGLANVAFCHASAECIPIKTAAIDVVLANGIFNLTRGDRRSLQNLRAWLVPGGSVYAAKLILRQPLPAVAAADEDNWFA